MKKPSERLYEATQRANVPLSCILELTRRCNLKCRHCYIDRPGGRRAPELSYRKVCDILEQLATEGTLYLTLTGGEIFLRPDLLDICRAARKLSFHLTLFTNGTLITEEYAETLASLQVSRVEISLYGKKRTHDRITGMPGAFEKTTGAIESLRRHGVPLTVKCPIMSLNFSEYRWVKSFAGKHKIECRFDPTIAPRDSGDRSILRYRLTDAQLEAIYRDRTISPPETAGNATVDTEIYCSAGRNLVAISADGTVYPCLQLLLPLGNLRNTAFTGIWNDENHALNEYRNIRFSELSECRSCSLSGACQRCPGLALLEDGDLRGPSSIACKTAKIKTNCIRKGFRPAVM